MQHFKQSHKFKAPVSRRSVTSTSNLELLITYTSIGYKIHSSTFQLSRQF